MLRVPEDSKVCNLCKYIKPLDMFHKTRKICKSCRKIENAKAYQKRKQQEDDKVNAIYDEMLNDIK